MTDIWSFRHHAPEDRPPYRIDPAFLEAIRKHAFDLIPSALMVAVIVAILLTNG